MAAAVMALSGCASVAREPDDLALVRVLGVDGAGPVVLTAVCGGDDQKDVNRGAVSASDFGTARREIPWSGTGEELALSGVSYLLVGPDVDMAGLLLAVLEDEELGATATVWLVEEGAGMVLEACGDPAADLELLELQGIKAPTAAKAAAALATEGVLKLPCLGQRDGRVEERGEKVWRVAN